MKRTQAGWSEGFIVRNAGIQPSADRQSVNYAGHENMKFEYYKSKDGWRWRLRSANNEIIASGEAYRNKKDCIACMQLILDLAPDTPIVKITLKSSDPVHETLTGTDTRSARAFVP